MKGACARENILPVIPLAIVVSTSVDERFEHRNAANTGSEEKRWQPTSKMKIGVGSVFEEQLNQVESVSHYCSGQGGVEGSSYE
jgi:hypothetical protein